MRTCHARRYGDVRLGTDQLGRTLAESPVSARLPHGLRARVLDLKVVILLPWR